MKFILLNYFGACSVVVEQSDWIVLLWSRNIYDFVMKPYSWYNHLFVKKRLTKTLISVMLIFDFWFLSETRSYMQLWWKINTILWTTNSFVCNMPSWPTHAMQCNVETCDRTNIWPQNIFKTLLLVAS